MSKKRVENIPIDSLVPWDYVGDKPQFRMEHWQLKVKCLRCGLHFILLTNDPDRHTAETIHCPECNQFGPGALFLIRTEHLDRPIFTVV